MNTNKNLIIPSDVDFIRIVWCDNANIIRAKAIYRDSADDSEISVGISEGLQGVPSTYDVVIAESGLKPIGEVKLTADLSTFTPLPYSPRHGRVMGDMIKEGRTWEYCPRGFLKKIIKKAAQMSLSVKGAFENEFYLLNKTEEGIIPVDNTPFASTYSMDLNREIIEDIIRALTLQEIEVQQYYPESGAGQQEITIKYTEALGACNNQIAFRETVKAVASKHGLIASFLPKIFADKSGSGCHLHLSLWEDGENILSDPRAWYGISERGRQFIAGILHHLPALMAITTPTPNSYRRIMPHSWVGAFQCWGIDNKEAAIRVIQENNGGVKNFELKTIDASSNPYLVLGAVIAAGLDGIKQEMELPEPVQMDPADIPDKNNKIKPLPSNLGEAIAELEKDKIILEAMGENLSKAYIAIKKTELEVLGDISLDEEVELLLEKY